MQMPADPEAAVEVTELFPRSEVPTLATRGPSGGHIKRQVIRSLSEQLVAVKTCFSAVDEWITLLLAKNRREERKNARVS